MTPFPVHDAPEALTIVQHLKAQTLFADACAAMQGQTSSQLLAIALPPGLYQGLQDAAIQAIEAHGLHLSLIHI